MGENNSEHVKNRFVELLKKEVAKDTDVPEQIGAMKKLGLVGIRRVYRCYGSSTSTYINYSFITKCELDEEYKRLIDMNKELSELLKEKEAELLINKNHN